MLDKMTKPLFWLGVLGALKLFTDTLGYTFIDDKQVNALADGIATICALIGVGASHNKPVVPEAAPEQVQEEQQ